ncbi:hypothetical protein [Achromobacter sp. ACM05]|uniref:hypothetical protein n=1 Tax=Achromobacter sp. ACM05 TaxID=2854776 RepID=UPI001C461391|nr:hypothetical protein [Achromobacter sp. ACM05]MBV7502088.1 hypothetical protein [Achromobacter sp. ACM05]
MDKQVMAKAFNMWMDDYTKNPERFEDISKAALAHLHERLEGKEPTYGEECAAILEGYAGQV